MDDHSLFYRLAVRIVYYKHPMGAFFILNIILHFGHNRPLLLKFINRRYDVKLHEKDFSTKQDMINYILNRESPPGTFSPPQTAPHK